MSRWGCGLSLAMVSILMASQSVNAAGRRTQYVQATCVSAQPTVTAVKTEHVTETVILGAGATYHLCIACPTDADVIIDGRRTFATGKIREFDIHLPKTETHDLSVVVLQNGSDILLNDTTRVNDGSRTIVVPPKPASAAPIPSKPAPKPPGKPVKPKPAKPTAADLKVQKEKETAQRIRELENRNEQLRSQQTKLLSGK